MRLAVFGLTVSSSWGNGHATLWRALIRALAERGHQVTFFERNVPYYADHRDLVELPWGTLVLYDAWNPRRALQVLAETDAAIVTSYCPDAEAAVAAMEQADALRVFYDLDTPVTLARLDTGERVDYVPAGGLGRFNLVLSYAGGPALAALERRLGARATAALPGFVDADAYRPGRPERWLRCDLSHLGTYAADRLAGLRELFLVPGERRPSLRLLLAGALYPPDVAARPGLRTVPHLSPARHPALYASSRWTINVTRGPMAAMGHCPSGRLFEGAACEAAIVTDVWPGLEEFFTAGEEIVTAAGCDEVLAALDMPPRRRRRIAEAARARVLAGHTARHRAAALERLLSWARANQALTTRDPAGGPTPADGVAAS
ncbi:MAG TPA: glycosyltransferase [Vicinamibacterales bacterium]